MSYVVVNALTVPADQAATMEQRFAARAGAVDGQPGFEGFELLRPTDDRHVWLVVTRWADQASYDVWVASKDFAAGHGGRPAGPDGMASKPGPDTPPERRPVGTAAELWSYEVAGGSTAPFDV